MNLSSREEQELISLKNRLDVARDDLITFYEDKIEELEIENEGLGDELSDATNRAEKAETSGGSNE